MGWNKREKEKVKRKIINMIKKRDKKNNEMKKKMNE